MTLLVSQQAIWVTDLGVGFGKIQGDTNHVQGQLCFFKTTVKEYINSCLKEVHFFLCRRVPE